ncbi:hypothetical protein [Methanobrevibacter sp.]|uniref:hypothetical protein n=1 Tax=Methanobrevibacter sp. TaxID=66852 RepID=UPI0038685F56
MNRKILFSLIILVSLFTVSSICAQGSGQNDTSITTDFNESDMHYGFCVLPEDMDKVDFKDLSNHGVTDLFLDYRVMDTHDKTQVETWIQDAKNEGISVHMFAQVFNDDEMV